MGRRGLLLTCSAANACALALVAFGCSAFGSETPTGETEAGSDVVGIDGSSPVDGAAVPDADAGTSHTDPGVFCGGAYCTPPAQVCCTTLAVGGEACVPYETDAAVCPGYRFACDDNADCPSDRVCCGPLNGNQREVYSTDCLPVLDCKKVSYYVVLCDPAASKPCPGDGGCTVPPNGGYGFCDKLRYDAPP